MNWKRIKAISLKEISQLTRDKNMLAMVLFAPILQLILLGYAATLDIKNISTVIVDRDNSIYSRELVSKISNSGYFTIEYYSDNYNEVQKYLDNGKVSLAIVIPNNFEKNILKNQESKIQTLIDGSEGNTSSIVQGYIQQIITQYSFSLLKNKPGIKLSNLVTPEIRVWYNPALKTRNFVIPGVMVLLLMIATMALTSMAIVKEREIGTLEQILVTPIKPIELMIGKMIPFIFVGYINITIVLIAMKLIFEINIVGSVLLLYFLATIFLLNSLGMGLVISTISRNKKEAMMFSMMFVFQPMLNLSGFIFAIELMPRFLQIISTIIPLKYFLIILRSIILKGANLFDLWDNALILLILGIILIAISVKRFNKKMD